MATHDPHLPDYEPQNGYHQAPLTFVTIPILLKHIERLKKLTALSLTLDECPSPEIIYSIASVSPRFQFLELGHYRYPPPEDNVCDHEVTAAWLMRQLPRLQTVSFQRAKQAYRRADVDDGAGVVLARERGVIPAHDDRSAPPFLTIELALHWHALHQHVSFGSGCCRDVKFRAARVEWQGRVRKRGVR
ncbi:hypothetical protein C8J57DRAFT_1218393 [Mycena rebaudengoi]|nr:hypothetical protein C8J57DRAFT_1218393 [Mycena rebaudengoi]